MRRLLLLTSALFLLAGVSATAATVNVVRGAGFGHGIGMSQYGAYGFALKGFGHERILAHYYRGTTLARIRAGQQVRVLLQDSDPYVRVKGITRGPGNRKLKPGVTYTARPGSAGRLSLSGGGRRVGSFRSPLRVAGGKRGVRLLGRAQNGLSSTRYRGAMELRRGSAGGVTAINVVPVDPYVRGVVAAEMPSSWHPEALKAQAVAARTYALATDKPGVFDQYADTRSQVYGGIAAETANTDRAVRATAGRVVTYDGDLATTFFFSTSGGRTENVENSFVGSEPQPWLKSVEDPYDRISPKHRWRFRFTDAQLDARLGAPGRFKRVKVLERGRSPRIVRARIYGTRGTRVLSGPSVRAQLGLYDTWAYFSTVSTAQVRSRRARSSANHSPVHEIAGSFTPAPRSGGLLVEQRNGHRWVRVSRIATTRKGRYRTTLGVSGTYRVRAGGVAGPAVRVS